MRSDDPLGSEASAPFRTRRDRLLATSLVIISIGGVSALPTFFLVPSMERNSFLFGYSLPRLLLGVVLLLVVLCTVAITVVALARPRLIAQAIWPFESAVAIEPALLVRTCLLLFYAAIVGMYWVLLFRFSLVPDAPYPLQILMTRLDWIAVWLVSTPIVVALALALSYREYASASFRKPSRAGSSVILFFIAVASTIHAITLALRAQWIFAIDGWFWQYTQKPISPSQIFILLAVLLAFGLSHLMLRPDASIARGVCLLIFTAYSLQLGFGFALGQGFTSIQARYRRTQFSFSDEMRLACESHLSTLAALRDYDTIYGRSFWYGTKPPGLFAFYSLARDVDRLVQPSSRTSSAGCFDDLSAFMAWSLPFLAALVVVPLIGVERLIGGSARPFIASLIFISSPSFTLMTMAPDQAMFPLLSMLAVLVIGVAMERDRWLLGFVGGVLLCVGVFVSFSLLPIVGLVLPWFALIFIFRGGRSERRHILRVAFATVVGFLMVTFVLALALNYNPLARFTAALAQHREIKDFNWSLPGVFSNGLLNNVELAFWSGTPLFVLMTLGVAKSVLQALARRPSRQDIFNVAFLAMVIGLNTLGQTRGEVGRIWIFVLPLAALVAAGPATALLRRLSTSVYLVLALQLAASTLAFAYLDWPW